MKLNKETNLLLLGLSFLAFISLGLPDGLLGVAWPSIAAHFKRPLSRLALLQLAGTAGFFISSTNAGRLIRRLGVGRLLIFSNILVALALTGFGFAGSWLLLLPSMLILGCGGGAVDAGLNAYSAERFTKEQVTLLHAFYGLGAMIGPVIMRQVLAGGEPWQRGYHITLAMVSALILLFLLTQRQWTRPSRPAEVNGSAAQKDASPKRLRAILVSGVMMFMIYTGLEVTAGSWGFTWLSEGRGIPPATAAFWISLYWGALTAGRLFFGFLGGRWHAKAIIVSMMLTVILGALLFLQPWSAIANLAAMPIIGFACAPIFPLLVSYTPNITGPKAAADIIGKQVAAASVGSALVPLVIGLGVELFNLSAIPIALLGSILLLTVFYRIWIGFEKKG